ncbi:tudor domain-containing protein 5-like isoform X4 [Bombus vancouverensis nearcticus]|uniref:tudor domain-containing protein 5-like isoform X4 n=1 Tax=Bombus vancouverensis nearcticus TaxID=2705178 RepID=UPI00402BD8E6
MQVDLQKRENTQTTILALLITRKGGCTLKQLNNDYYELEGEHIPWKDLGYNSLLSFLHSMSKTVQIEHRDSTIIIRGIASEKSKHVSKLIAGQKTQKPSVGRKTHKPNHYFPTTAPNKIRIPAEILSKVVSLVKDKPNGLNKDYILQEIHSRMPFVKITMKEMEEQLQELSHRIFQTNNKVYPNRSKVKNFNNLKGRNDMSHSKSKLPIITAAGNEDSDDMLDCEDVPEVTHLNRTSKPDYTKSDTKTTSTSSFIKETKYQETQHSNDIKTKFDDDIMKAKENVLDKKDIEILINERIKFRLEKLIQNHSDGIWCADLPEKYLEEYKVSLNYAELGFNSVREFASQLPEIFHCIQPGDTGDFMLYYAKREIPSNKLTKKHEANNVAQLYDIYESSNEEAVPASVSLDTCKKLIPDNVMSIGDYVGCINVADLEQNEEPFIEVIVVEVFTPSFFWIQLRKKQKTFKMFMDDLHKFYTVQYEQYAIPLLVLEKGLNCACVYNGIWHRGIIKAVKPDFQVTVMFYDYGTLKTYSPDAVYYLHKRFSILPAQAIPCGLINTRPCTGSKWSRSATHHFALRTSDIPLVATIATINKEDNSMMVNLTDTLEDEDVHISDWLVEQKLAEYGKMENSVDMSNLLLYVEENLIFMPEQCYEKETDIYNGNNEKLSENATDVPLVSPQSVLNDMFIKPSSECTLFDEQEILLAEKNIQDQIFQSNSTFNKSNTNPFLQVETPYGQVNNDRSSQKFMELWNENLQMQIQHLTQINATLRLLLYEVIKSSLKNNSSTYDKSTLNMIKSVLLNINKQMPIFVNPLHVNTESAYENISSNGNVHTEKKTAINENVDCPVEYVAPAAINKQPLTSNFYDRIHTHIDSSQNNYIQDEDRNLNTVNYNSLISGSNNTNAINQSLLNQQMSVTSCVSPGFGKFSNKCFTSTDLSTPIEHSMHNGTSFKETNPFRLSLAENVKPFNHNWNVDDNINTTSKSIISGQSTERSAHQKEMENQCFSSSKKSFIDDDLQFVKEIYKQEPVQANDDTSDFEVDAYNVGAKNSYLKKTEFTVGKVIYVPKCLSANCRMFFRAVELPKQIIHIFYYQEEGWLLVDEFIQVLTESETTIDMAKLLYAFNIYVQFKEIDRTKNSIEFIKSGSILSKATYDIINGSDKLCLIPLKSLLKVLYKLEIISYKDINNIFVHEQIINGSTKHKIWLIINAYGEFKYYIENRQ